MRPWLVLGVGMLGLVGCSLFPPHTPEKTTGGRASILPPIQPKRESIQLEVLFVERPADDPALGHALWREIDELGDFPTETRVLLQKNGFRIGHVGSSIPPAVQILLGLVSRENGENQNLNPLIGNRKILPPGMDTEVQTAEERESGRFRRHNDLKIEDHEYFRLRSLFRMKSVRLQDGWVRVDFQPEIHHGENRVRHTPTEDGLGLGWGFQNRQNVETRHSDRFSVTLNIGEMAIITSDPTQDETLGNLFFCREDGGVTKQRVLIVRLAASGTP